jgi:UDP-glucuronate 4-epimerase
MTVLVTGAAGFIGYHVSAALLTRGDPVVGVDDLNSYYDVALKEARLDRLRQFPDFTFHRLNIADRGALARACASKRPRRVIHLAAQAGVRHSLTNPFAYVHCNLVGHIEVLELCRHLAEFEHLVYASSSSVYGGNTKLPFAVADRVDTPISLYAATKKADELMSHSYSHLYNLPATGLRFFTVYGPWGRPDMAAYLFASAIAKGEPVKVFNHGNMKRDFTYIDDIVKGVLAALDSPPQPNDGAAAHKIYNLGNHRAESLMRFIAIIENAFGKKAKIKMEDMQPGDVKETFADIDDVQRDLGFRPETPIDVGIPRFVEWYRAYHKV